MSESKNTLKPYFSACHEYNIYDELITICIVWFSNRYEISLSQSPYACPYVAIFNPFIFIFDLNLFSFKFKLHIQHVLKFKTNSYLNCLILV